MRNAQIRRLNPLDYSGTEAVNTICSNLSFAGMHLRKVVLTSCNSGDGKSYMTMQIACNLASRGKRVVLVDADLRKSNLVSRYGITCEGEMTGLVHYLAGRTCISPGMPIWNIIRATLRRPGNGA